MIMFLGYITEEYSFRKVNRVDITSSIVDEIHFSSSIIIKPHNIKLQY